MILVYITNYNNMEEVEKLSFIEKIMVHILERKHYVYIRKDGDKWRVDLPGKCVIADDLFTLDGYLEDVLGEND